MRAFVQIATDTAQTTKILESLKSYEEIEQIFVLFGKWDIVAIANLENAENLGTFVIDKIRVLPGVTNTATQIVAQKIQ